MIEFCQNCERYPKFEYVNCLCKFHVEGNEPVYCFSGVGTYRGVCKDSDYVGTGGSGSSTALDSAMRLLLLT